MAILEQKKKLIFEIKNLVGRLNNRMKTAKEKNQRPWGTWVAQSVELLTLADIMISRFMSLSPASGSAWNLLWILCLDLSAPPPLTFCVYVSLSQE